MTNISKLKVGMLIIAAISIALAISAMLDMQTLILPPSLLVALYLPILVLGSLLLGVVVKAVVKSDIGIIIYASFFATVFSIWFYASQYQPSYIIALPNNFTGTVHLFVTDESKDDFTVNRYGIGYISKKTYRNGFRPTVLKNGQNITAIAGNFSTGTTMSAGLQGNTLGPYSFLSFSIPSGSVNDSAMDVEKLIAIHALDTLRASKNSD